ncbi:hypothetical protein [Providencia rettgeri]|uniref:hypothetical protein n=1 Tax=Providencia rettgeri TaxID=587 RepID=UPI000BCC1C71|nr:hypothetical protein [Providencia rettgeri]PCQ37167.1 hypothetical protein CQA26_15175 [Providencia rettgeri]
MNSADFYKKFGIVADANVSLEGNRQFIKKAINNSFFVKPNYSQVQYSYGTEVTNGMQQTTHNPLYTY